MHCIASPHQDRAPAKTVIVIKHLNLLERQEGCMDNNTLYSHVKHDTFQSHLNIDYLILTSEPSYYLHLTDGKEMETWTICHLPKVTKQTNSYPCFLLFRPRAGSFLGGPLSAEAKSVLSPTFCLGPCFWDAAVGRENVSSVASYVCGKQFVTNMK